MEHSAWTFNGNLGHQKFYDHALFVGQLLQPGLDPGPGYINLGFCSQLAVRCLML